MSFLFVCFSISYIFSMEIVNGQGCAIIKHIYYALIFTLNKDIVFALNQRFLRKLSKLNYISSLILGFYVPSLLCDKSRFK